MKIVKLWLPVIAWAGLIFYVSSLTHLSTGLRSDLVFRKIAHALEYYVLVLLLSRAFRGSFRSGVLELYIYPAVLSFLYAISDEFHQSFVPGRIACAQDVLIDCIGIISYLSGVGILRWKRGK
jgi:VanZ family protein